MDLYDIPLQAIDGSATTLAPFRGKPLLIVNVASRCGFTPQYKGLEMLYRKYKDKGLVVLGFPCNQFGHQEPGSDADIHAFCDRTYGVTFPMFAKIDVNGPTTHPLYRHLKAAKKGWFGREDIAWNFTKFLVGREGEVRHRYNSRWRPEQIEKDLAALI